MTDLGVILLDYRVKILCIPNYISWKSMIIPILKLLLDDNSNFITYTKSENEFSIILDEKCLSIFSVEEKSMVNIDPNTYFILQIFEDYYSPNDYCENGINHVGVVTRLSRIFSDNNIPILYINSYNNNYILFSEEYKMNIKNLFPGFF